MTTALYRLSTNEVVKISTKNQSFSDRDPLVWGVLTDPTTPDGTQVREDLGTELGPLRVLGFSKIAEPGSNNVRNAIQAEIDTFVPGETDDNNQLDADQAGEIWETHPQFRKLFVAFSDILKDEINLLRAQWETFQADVATANNLGDLKISVAAYAAKPPRTLAQLRNQIKVRISKDD